MQNNVGSNTLDNIAPLKLLTLEVYYNEDSMANILYLNLFLSLPGVWLAMESSKEQAILVDFEEILIKFQ